MKRKILNMFFIGIMLIATVFILTGCGKTPSNAENTTEQKNTSNDEFYMVVQQGITITGRGTVITGQIEQGSLKEGDEIVLISTDNSELSTKVEEIMVANKRTEEIGVTDELVQILVKNIDRQDVERGQIIIKKDAKFEKEQLEKIMNNFQEKLNSQKMSYKDYASLPNDNKSDDLLMVVEEVFKITGKGVTATARVSRGTAKIGDSVQIVGLNDEITDTTIVSMQQYRNEISEAHEGDSISIILDNINEEDDIKRGQVIVKPNSIKAAKKFTAKIYVLTNEEGGRKTAIPDNYSASFYFRITECTGKIKLLDNIQSAKLGEESNIEVELTESFAMEVNTKFAIREGGRTIAYGIVTDIYD